MEEASEVRDDAPVIWGRWNGANIERRSNCTNSQNNGQHGTYGQFDIANDGEQGRRDPSSPKIHRPLPGRCGRLTTKVLPFWTSPFETHRRAPCAIASSRAM